MKIFLSFNKPRVFFAIYNTREDGSHYKWLSLNLSLAAHRKRRKKKLRNKCSLLRFTENLIWSKYKLSEVSFYIAGKLSPHSSEEVCTDTLLTLEKSFLIALI